jgi:hypothetical protein
MSSENTINNCSLVSQGFEDNKYLSSNPLIKKEVKTKEAKRKNDSAAKVKVKRNKFNEFQV